MSARYSAGDAVWFQPVPGVGIRARVSQRRWWGYWVHLYPTHGTQEMVRVWGFEAASLLMDRLDWDQ